MNLAQPVADLVSSLEVGNPAVAGNLAIFPLLTKASTATTWAAPYLLYEQAQAMGMLSIEEREAGGVVSELVVNNVATEPVPRSGD